MDTEVEVLVGEVQVFKNIYYLGVQDTTCHDYYTHLFGMVNQSGPCDASKNLPWFLRRPTLAPQQHTQKRGPH